MIKKIILVNWRSHAKSTIEFANGTNIIVGRMGGGKSSIIDAICFALFGTTPAVQHRRLKITDFIKNRPKEESEAEVTLIFTHRNDEYTVIRRIKRKGGSEAEIKKNGTRVEGPQSERVTQYIEHLLEIDYELFTRAIYSEQNRIDYFLTLGRGERKRQIDELIGIDKFENVRKNIGTVITRIKTMKADKELFIKNSNPIQLENEIAEMEKEITKLTAEKTTVKNEFERLARLKEQKEHEINQLRQLREQHRKLQDEITGIKHNLDLLNKDISSTQIKESLTEIENKLKSIKSEKEKVQNELNAIDKEYNETVNKLSSSKTELENIRRKKQLKEGYIKEIETLLKGKKKEDMKKELEDIDKRINEIRSHISDSKARISEIVKSMQELKTAGSHCPVCDSELPEEKKHNLIVNRENMLRQLETQNLSNAREMNELERKLKTEKEELNKIERLESLIKEYDGLEEREKTEEKRKNEAESRMKEISEKRNYLNTYYQNTNNEYIELSRIYERIKELENKKKKATELNLQLKSKEEEIRRIKFDEKTWEEENKKLNETNLEYVRIKGKIEQIEDKEGYMAKLVSEKKKRIEEIKKYRGEIEKYEKIMNALQVFSTAVVETQHELREELIEEINQALSTIWDKVYPYSDYNSVRLVAEENDYDLMFGINGEYVSVDGVASGGERALACLALRIAFSIVLTPNLSWLILDEPTHNLDEEAVRTLAETLREHIPQIVEQTFVITHDELMKEAASGKLVRIQRDPDHPENSKVEELNEITVSTPSMS